MNPLMKKKYFYFALKLGLEEINIVLQKIQPTLEEKI